MQVKFTDNIGEEHVIEDAYNKRTGEPLVFIDVHAFTPDQALQIAAALCIAAERAAKHAIALGLVEGKIAAGELVRLDNGGLVKAEEFDPAVHTAM